MASSKFGALSRYGGMGTAEILPNSQVGVRTLVSGLEIIGARARIGSQGND